MMVKPSPYSVGLAYEVLVLNTLRRHMFQLMHTGGAGDGGQDFSGFWNLPNKRVPVVGQCKCFRLAVGPAGVREFEDVLFRKFVAVESHQQQCYLGVMASKSWFTPSALRTFHSSRLPMILTQITPKSGRGQHPEGRRTDTGCGGSVLRQFVLNSAAQRMLNGQQVVWRSESSSRRHLSIVK